MAKGKQCYKKVKSKGTRPYIVLDKKGRYKSNFSSLKELKSNKKFKKLRRC